MLLSLFVAGSLLGSAPSLAAPGHPRAVAVQPRSLKELQGERPVRVYWDQGASARVELLDGERWELLAEGVEPGWESKPLPQDAVLRVVQDAQPSASLVVVWGLDAQGVARLGWPQDLPGVQVADISPADEDTAWVALLSGGLVRADRMAYPVQSFGVAEGLPSPQVNAVLHDGEQLWVGTSKGLALIEGGRVVRVWDSSLSDAWVQVLAPDPQGGVYVGTYHGLDRLQEQLTPLLSPRSVFSLTQGRDGRTWVGYEGLRGLPEGEPIEGVRPDLNIWDSDSYLSDRVLLATDTAGILSLQSGQLSRHWMPQSGAVYAMERLGSTLYAAADSDGLVALREGRVVGRWGRAQGLPSDVVYQVAAGPPEKLWVGTDAGLALLWPKGESVAAWPVAGAAAGRRVAAVVGQDGFAFLGTEHGVVSMGEVPRRYRDATGLPGPVVGMVEQPQGRSLWVVGPKQAWRVRPSGLERFDLPARVHSVQSSGGMIWVGGVQGLYRHDGGLERFVPVLPGPVTAMEVGPTGALWVASGAQILAVDQGGQARHYLQASPALGLCQVGAQLYLRPAQGLEVLNVASGKVGSVYALQGQELLALACDGDQAVVLSSQRELLRVPSGEPVQGAPELWSLGEITGMELDQAGRVWVMGEAGVAVLGLW